MVVVDGARFGEQRLIKSDGAFAELSERAGIADHAVDQMAGQPRNDDIAYPGIAERVVGQDEERNLLRIDEMRRRAAVRHDGAILLERGGGDKIAAGVLAWIAVRLPAE